jgi:phosphatidylglycerophosphate synthase
MTDLALLLLQEGTTRDPNTIGVFRFFAAFFLIMFFYLGALGFTYWISKDE